MQQLLRVLCLIRLSSKCLRLEEEATTVNTLHAKYQLNHAAEILQCQARAWVALRNPSLDAYGLPGFRAAVFAVKVMKLHALVRTSRVTPETIVCNRINRLQRLLDRSQDRSKAHEMFEANREVRNAMMASAMSTGTADQSSRSSVKLSTIADTRMARRAVHQGSAVSVATALKFKENKVFNTRGHIMDEVASD